MRRMGMVVVIGTLLGSASAAQAVDVSITTPKNGDIVSWRETVAGRVSDPAAEVWVVIHPFSNGETRYWVQPRTTVKRNGRWSVLAYFANASSFYSGLKFRVRACAGPKVPLSEGQIFYTWPPCAKWSRVVVVERE